jgi:hypothetical protein
MILLTYASLSTNYREEKPIIALQKYHSNHKLVHQDMQKM